MIMLHCLFYEPFGKMAVDENKITPGLPFDEVSLKLLQPNSIE